MKTLKKFLNYQLSYEEMEKFMDKLENIIMVSALTSGALLVITQLIKSINI